MKGGFERRPPPPAPEIAAAAAAAIAILAVKEMAPLALLALGALIGFVSARLRHSAPLYVFVLGASPFLEGIGAGIGLVLVPLLSAEWARPRTASRDARILAFSALGTLALVATGGVPTALAIALVASEIAAALVGLAAISLRTAAGRARRTAASDAPLPLLRVARSTAGFALSAAAIAALVFLFLPRRELPDGASSNLDAESNESESGERTRRRPRARRPGPDGDPGAARLDPRRAIRLPDPETEAFVVSLTVDGKPLRDAGSAGLYFREATLERTDGDTWWHDDSRLKLRGDRDDGRDDGTVSFGEPPPGASIVEQDFEVRGLSERYIAMAPALALRAESVLLDASGILVQASRTPVTGRYRATSVFAAGRPPDAAIARAEASRPAAAEELVVPRVSPSVAAIADEIRSRFPRAGAFLLSAEARVRESAAYRLEDRSRLPREADPVEDLLVRGRDGHCETFAAAMAVLARAAGIPARIAIGYRGAVPGGQPGRYVVLARDRHAWVEANLEGLATVRFDPTPAALRGYGPADAAEAGGDETTGNGLAFSSVFSFLANLDAESQGAALAAIADAIRHRPFALAIAVLALAALVLGRAALAAAAVRSRARRALAATSADEERAVAALLCARRRVESALGPLPPATTPREIARRAAALPEPVRKAVCEIVRAHEAARYAGRPLLAARIRDVVRELR